MFFIKELEHSLVLHPSFFKAHMHAMLSQRLLQDLEGTVKRDYYIVCVLDNYQFGDGKVIPGSSSAEYQVHFRAIVWKPFRGEVVDGIVGGVLENGFFVDIGAMQAFVSKNLIPSDIKFNSLASPPQWSDNGDQVIERGKHVRMKIRGIRNEVSDIYAVGTIKEDFLGSTVGDGNTLSKTDRIYYVDTPSLSSRQIEIRGFDD